MTKKQMGIMFTLLALIVCTALLAGKLNKEGLNSPTNISEVLSEEDNNVNSDTNSTKNSKDKATSAKTKDTKNTKETAKKTAQKTKATNTQDFFYDAINSRDTKDAETLEELNNQIKSTNIDANTKKEISNKIKELTLRQDKQKTVELNLKNKGYEYSICQISEDGSKADVTLKAENIDDTESALIQEIVEDAASISNVTIEYIK